jgi:6-phosphogluconolactonase (cycloisomerase 2 family)
VYVSNTGSNDVSVLRINANGTLSAIAGSPFAMTGMTTSEGLAMTPDAENVYVANYGTDRISGFNVNATTGALSPTSGSPYGTGVRADAVLGVTPDPDGGHLFAYNHNAVPPSIATWTINGNGSLTEIVGSPNTDPAGNQDPFAGSVAPDGDHLYVPMENTTPPGGAQDESAYFSVGANGSLSFILDFDTGGPLAADGNPFGSGILPNGQCLYVSAPEDLATVGRIYGFSIANDSPVAAPGSPYTLNGGSHPLTIAAAPDSEHIYVATRQSDSVNAFNVNADCSLTTTPGSPFGTGGDNGKSLALTPDGSRLYVINNAVNSVSGFNVNPTTGALSLIPGSPFATGGTGADLEGIAITPNQPPTAAFSPTTLAPAGQASIFNATISVDGDGGTVARYDWDFGDGTTLPDGGPTPQHTYDQPGTYTVQLTVTDNENCSTGRVFTGKATLCNGNTGATISQQVTIAPAAQAQQAQCIVPDVVGKKKKKAKAAIAAANCTVGTTKKKRSSKVKKKKVIKQKPPAGTVLPAGSPVDLKVSKGKPKD